MAETLPLMQAIFWISRVPERLTAACDLIHAVAPDLMSQPEVSAHRSLGVVYGEVKQRWLIVYSPEAHQRALKTVNKQSLKQSTAELKRFHQLCQQTLKVSRKYYSFSQVKVLSLQVKKSPISLKESLFLFQQT